MCPAGAGAAPAPLSKAVQREKPGPSVTAAPKASLPPAGGAAEDWLVPGRAAEIAFEAAGGPEVAP
jgi:hypothetical protein